MTSNNLKGNNLTKRMHFLTLKELKRLERETNNIHWIKEEKKTLLPLKRTGSYDFLIESSEGLTGFEVMTRPTKGKLKEKLRYKGKVNVFVFVLPSNSLGLYRKPQKNGLHCTAKPKFFPKEFFEPSLQAWLLDAKTGRFTEKGAFFKIFNVERQ
ncbi:MAG: hypothetical protein QXK06_05460 [Candidatus Diapherotrites archaeon]